MDLHELEAIAEREQAQRARFRILWSDCPELYPAWSV